MKKILQLTIAMLSITALAARTSDIAVTSTIADTDPSGTAYYVQSDGLFGGVYANGQAGVTSILQGGSYWELQTYNSSFTASSGRNALITLGPANQESAAATLPSIWSSWGTHLDPVRFIVHCCSCPLQSIRPGSPLACPIFLRFGPPAGTSKSQQTYYRLDMVGPNLCKQCVNEPETQEVQISCNAQDASGNCNDWSIDSIPPTSQSGGVPTNQVIARLSLVTDGSYIGNEGDFYLTFHIHVTNP